MKKYWLLILALIIGFGLRVYNLSDLPNGLTWDEAAPAKMNSAQLSP
ncbi:MAG: hypothetical protein UW35_C0049G0001 [Candidatus Collierbacteria bacterium GW2011_GWF2_44_15]|uniref:Uncharacterized protein n=1 Tax=Candidatus Collierbacteria bacterium GW2011_GWF2_44_15 TaxID=1618404 RepID=A0A0G1HAE8_9BACT|nr:MAG: hypothetical protein UW35_C0049G0001 [Candidatus Collierbacteria bacterium GW2011_GWF2_44_15]